MANPKDFILNKFQMEEFPDPVPEVVQAATEDTFKSIYKIIQRRQAQHEQRNLSQYISQSQRKQDIEKNIKTHKLKEAERMKRELEGRLFQIDESIGRIQKTQKPEEVSKRPRVQIQDSVQRQMTKQQEEQKIAEAAEIAKRFQQQQQELKRREKAKRKEREEKLAEEQRQEELKRQKKEEEKQIAYYAHLEDLDRKAQARKEELEGRIASLQSDEKRSMKSQKPLYMQLEDKYKRTVILPQLDQRKAEIARKRELSQPIDHQEIQNHAKWFQDTQDQFEARRIQAFKARKLELMSNQAAQNYSSKYIESYKEEKRQASIERERARSERKHFAEKRQRYSEIVAEMYAPTIDRMKAMEIDIVKEKTKQGVRPKALLRNDLSHGIESVHGHSSSDVSFNWNKNYQPKKFKRNPLLPPPEIPKAEPTKVDYLAERRRARESFSPARFRNQNRSMDAGLLKYQKAEDPRQHDIVRKRAHQMEQVARRQELILSDMPKDNITGIEATDEVNSMLINSIKAKLSILEND